MVSRRRRAYCYTRETGGESSSRVPGVPRWLGLPLGLVNSMRMRRYSPTVLQGALIGRGCTYETNAARWRSKNRRSLSLVVVRLSTFVLLWRGVKMGETGTLRKEWFSCSFQFYRYLFLFNRRQRLIEKEQELIMFDCKHMNRFYIAASCI